MSKGEGFLGDKNPIFAKHLGHKINGIARLSTTTPTGPGPSGPNPTLIGFENNKPVYKDDEPLTDYEDCPRDD